mmetsp:Transcript_5250/g.6431  ORF Transcript_5250/g.6431 Transcript_5250/m.6431 type:complete len:82 (-) Transcript_5250:745-990(-)
MKKESISSNDLCAVSGRYEKRTKKPQIEMKEKKKKQNSGPIVADTIGKLNATILFAIQNDTEPIATQVPRTSRGKISDKTT